MILENTNLKNNSLGLSKNKDRRVKMGKTYWKKNTKDEKIKLPRER